MLAIGLATLAATPVAAKSPDVSAATSKPLPDALSKDGCSPDENLFGQTPSTITDPLDPSVLAKYAVLRRAAAARDQPPPINSLSEQVSPSLGRYNPAYIRQLTQRPGGRRFFLVPGLPMPTEVPPARCLPVGERANHPDLVEEQARRDREVIACVVTIRPPSRGAYGSSDVYGDDNCPRLRDVTKYDQLARGLLEGGEQAGILPDQIATVRVHFGDAPTVQVPVVENFYLYKVGRAQTRKLSRQLSQILRHIGRRAGTKAQRRKRERRFVARVERAVRRFMPTRIELLAADGRRVKDVRRSKSSEFGLGRPING